MNTIRRFLLSALLISGTALSHDIASQLRQAHPTQLHIKLEEKIADKSSDITFNAATVAVGALLFWIGVRTHPEQAKPVELFSFIAGIGLSTLGAYNGIHDKIELNRLKDKLNACNSAAKSK